MGKAIMLAALLLASYSPNAEAIIINDTVGPAGSQALGAPHLGVVNITQGGSNWCSGSLIDATHILTAQHCTTGEAAGNFTIDFVGADGITVVASRSVSAKAEIAGYDDNMFLLGLDVAILTMSSAAPAGFSALSLGISDPTGLQATTVGFGLQGIGSIGYYGNGSTDAGGSYSYDTRWAADNIIDHFGGAIYFGSEYFYYNPATQLYDIATTNILNTDFDGPLGLNYLSGYGSSATPLPNEGTTCYGDSGGPLLVSGLIMGVLSGGYSPLNVCEEPDVSWWTGTFAANVRSFIESNSSALFVPEPSTLILLALGMGALGLRGRRSRPQAS